MEVKLAQISGVVVEDLNTTFGYVKKDETRDEIEQIKENIDNNIDENVEIKSLSTIKNKSIILDYIERFFKRTIDKKSILGLIFFMIFILKDLMDGILLTEGYIFISMVLIFTSYDDELSLKI